MPAFVATARCRANHPRDKSTWHCLWQKVARHATSSLGRHPPLTLLNHPPLVLGRSLVLSVTAKGLVHCTGRAVFKNRSCSFILVQAVRTYSHWYRQSAFHGVPTHLPVLQNSCQAVDSSVYRAHLKLTCSRTSNIDTFIGALEAQAAITQQFQPLVGSSMALMNDQLQGHRMHARGFIPQTPQQNCGECCLHHCMMHVITLHKKHVTHASPCVRW